MPSAPARALACVLILPLAACTARAAEGGFAPPGAAASTASAAAPPPPPVPSRPEDVLGSYREFHRVLEAALGGNDASRLPEVAAEPLASRLVAMVEEQRGRSVVRRTHLALNPRLAWIRHRTALVLDCVHSPGFTTFDAVTGRRLGPRPVTEQALVETRLKLEDALAGRSWKVWRVGEVRPC
ncbi:hypothetical protein [Actinocorallia populi]|uniref:hypothetical protein n=1 Tax=Actinocorallia populi TaxID=2079200 RepID=UPI000D094340|nr:hypothetical protein [Actinocorallia populi]